MNIYAHNETLALLPHDMLKCACGNIERRMYANDGRRSTPTLEVSRLVVDTTQAQSARVFVRQEVAVQRIVSFIYHEVASTNRGRSFEENQGFLTLAISPVAPRQPSTNVKPLDGCPMLMLPCALFHANAVASSYRGVFL